MSEAPPLIAVLSTLEIRWILPGPLEDAVAGWFGRFPAEADSRQDAYLARPDLRGLSVKIRAGRTFEVKLYRGGAGMLDIPGRAQGRIQSWQKWSFPVGPLSQDDDADRAGWTVIRKRRRISRFRLADGRVVAGGLAGEPGCAVELTEFRVGDQAWWSLGFEAAGPAELLYGALKGTAALIFVRALPGGAELGQGDCRSYAEWLSCTARPG